MTQADENFAALAGYLAGNFAEADLAGMTDEQAAVAELSRRTMDWHREVSKQGRGMLAAPAFDWRRVADYANRDFRDEQQARAWLTRMMDILEKAIARL